MTEDDFYEIKVYPKGHRITLRFVGDGWHPSWHEEKYNSYVAPLVRRYSKDWMSWGDRITLTHGFYVWTWEQSVLDIKGDG
jgi:hypothetical protein